MSNSYWNNIRTFIAGSRARGNIVDDDLDGITAGFDAVEVDVERSIKLATSSTDQVLTQSVSQRIAKYLVFDASGNITISAGTGADSGLRADLASIINGAGASLVAVEDAAGNFTEITVEAVLAELVSNLASTANAKGAALIGIEDAATNFTATDVEAALAEIIADLAAVTTGNGASKVGVEDSAGNFTGTTVETVLAEMASEAISGAPTYGGASSAGTDAYAATLPVSPGAYAAGQRFSFLADVDNTGACTANFNSIGAAPIKMADGSDPFDGAIQADSIAELEQDGTNFILLNPFYSSDPTTIKTTGDQAMADSLAVAGSLQSWDSGFPGIDFGSVGGKHWATSGATYDINNARYYNVGWKYNDNGYATLIQSNKADGTLIFYTAPENASGTGAVATFTERMRVSPSGVTIEGNTAWHAGNQQIIVKTADETVNNSSTLQNDDHFSSISLSANTLYKIEIDIELTNTVGAGFKIGWTFSQALADTGWANFLYDDSASGGANYYGGFSFASASIGLSDYENYGSKLTGYFKSNASNGGTLTITWAQDAATVGNTTMRIGSTLKLTKVG